LFSCLEVLERSQAAVDRAGLAPAGFRVEVRAALRAEPPAGVRAERFHRDLEQDLLIDQGVEVDQVVPVVPE
jgi:hypothetical protein